MKFNRKESEKELNSLLMELEINLDSNKYPQLSKMKERGYKHNWKDYLDKRKADKS